MRVIKAYLGKVHRGHRIRKATRALQEKKDNISKVVNDFEALSIQDKEQVIARVLANHKKDFNLEKHFADADVNKDGKLTAVEFQSYIASQFLPKTLSNSIGHSSMEPPSARQLRLVMLASGIPFIGFGVVDNLIMLTAGDFLETNIRLMFPISIVAAAGLGNCVADVMGLSLGGVIESFARKLGIQDPQLSSTQARMAHVRAISYFSQAIGISFGCLVGMFPLLFMDFDDEDEDEAKEAAKKRYRVRMSAMPSDVMATASD
ncbi:Transmembrane protein 65 [Aphanomyces cochlioides]|nr:Transmembrane protein 65 [Aphanomyces cochlioides]